MSEFEKWAPAEELAAAVELRQPGTPQFAENFMDNGGDWFASHGRLGASHGWTLEETVDHMLENVGQWASRLIKPQTG